MAFTRFSNNSFSQEEEEEEEAEEDLFITSTVEYIAETHTIPSPAVSYCKLQLPGPALYYDAEDQDPMFQFQLFLSSFESFKVI